MFRKRNMVIVIVTIVMLIASLVPSPAQAAGYDFTTQQTRWAGNGQVRVSSGVHIESGRVYSTWRDCRVAWSTWPTRIDITWCGVWNNGSNSYMDVGANYTVRYFLPNGQEYYRYDGWMRTRVYPNGHVQFLP